MLLALINPAYKDRLKKITKTYLEKISQYKDSFAFYFCETADGCDF